MKRVVKKFLREGNKRLKEKPVETKNQVKPQPEKVVQPIKKKSEHKL